MLRRTLDLVGGLVLFALALPAIAAAAAAVLLTSGRPAFFGHVRVGRDGRLFRCWKLRTMHIDAEARLDRDPALKAQYVRNGYKLPADRDPRITPVGRVLRRYCIDELPQLVNVVLGSMSLVGPRPIVAEELRQYGRRAHELLAAKPGIVGAWTLHGRRRPTYPERARIELDYVRSVSPARDLLLFFRAIPVVLRGEGER
jgi:lipopolysaccharide/colanic/teichoic acid biosynthesis glycosyltransferase